MYSAMRDFMQTTAWAVLGELGKEFHTGRGFAPLYEFRMSLSLTR